VYEIGPAWQMKWYPFCTSIHFLLEIVSFLLLAPQDAS